MSHKNKDFITSKTPGTWISIYLIYFLYIEFIFKLQKYQHDSLAVELKMTERLLEKMLLVELLM